MPFERFDFRSTVPELRFIAGLFNEFSRWLTEGVGSIPDCVITIDNSGHRLLATDIGSRPVPTQPDINPEIAQQILEHISEFCSRYNRTKSGHCLALNLRKRDDQADQADSSWLLYFNGTAPTGTHLSDVVLFINSAENMLADK